MSAQLDFFASCPKGLESQLREELILLGASQVRETVAGVSFSGELETAYRACLWTRLANRILLRIAKFPVETAEELYVGIQTITWLDHLKADGTFMVDFRGQTKDINNTHFGALKTKDAIVDQIRQETSLRPSVVKEDPSLKINVLLSKGQGIVSIDLSGQSLHQRGYRKQAGAAPMKENLAAAVLLRSGWQALADEGAPLVDPMCGSATFLIEAVLIAADIAPGLSRDRFGFQGWLGHKGQMWQQLRQEAQRRRIAGLEKFNNQIVGYEADERTLHFARNNISRIGLDDHIRIEQAELGALQALPSDKGGLLVSNPPYGERLGEQSNLIYLYQHLGAVMCSDFVGWKGGILTSNPDLGKRMGIRSRKQYKYFNGTLESKLLCFDIEEQWFVRKAVETPKGEPLNASVAAAGARLAPIRAVLSDGAQMFANRLRKNRKALAKWIKQENIEAYRLYDADMPEYSVAIDVYRDCVIVQEYQAPKTIDPAKAKQRLLDVMSAIPDVLEVDRSRVVLKERKRQSGKEQYERRDEKEQKFEVKEHGCKFLVNMTDYLDTGLFLDHRPLRLRLQKEARGKRFLNLFCYTAAATVHAAKGGAIKSVSVDMSNTYLDWGRQNLSLNGFSDRHELVQQNCTQWLAENNQMFDLIFLDPPTFSNSKRMHDVFDIQEDHADLVTQSMQALEDTGVMYFSNNFRRFKLDESLHDLFEIEEISAETIDKDFTRNTKIHRCWKVRHCAPRQINRADAKVERKASAPWAGKKRGEKPADSAPRAERSHSRKEQFGARAERGERQERDRAPRTTSSERPRRSVKPAEDSVQKPSEGAHNPWKKR